MTTLCNVASGLSNCQQISIFKIDQQVQALSCSSKSEPAKPSMAQGLRLVLGSLLQILPFEYNWLLSMLLAIFDWFEFFRGWWAYVRRKL
jgi:hypothetical protein